VARESADTVKERAVHQPYAAISASAGSIAAGRELAGAGVDVESHDLVVIL